MPAKVATPLQSVDLLDCAVEHLSWLERRIGLRDARGIAKKTWDGELLSMLGKRAKRLERRASSHRVKGPRRLKTVAVLPFFATSPECEDPKAACTTGSSAPAMRRHFLNTTYWSIVDALTPHVVLSTCSHTDAEFARSHSGLKWFDVLESECFIPRRITGVPFFKPALLGAKTVHAIRDKLQNDPRWSFDYVYYSEADQVLHTRNARFMLSVVDENTYVSPHRMQPIAHPSDMPSLSTPEGRDWLPRWSQQDLARMERIGPVTDVDRAKNWRCCVGRSECTGDGLQGDRSTWTPWKVPKPQLGLVRYDNSFVMVAAHQGSYGKLEFRGCTLEESAEACPFDDRVVAKPPPKKHAGRAGHVARPAKRGFRPGHPSQNLFDLNRGEPGPERKPRKVKGMRCGPAGTCRPDGGEVEGMTPAARQVLDQDRYLARLVEKQN